MSKISFENWSASKGKWDSIVEKTKRGEEFCCGGDFTDLNVIEPCGYCRQFQTNRVSFGSAYTSCDPCPLFQQKICFHSDGGADILFWQYVLEMFKPKDERDISRAIDLAEKIRDFIGADKP